MADKIISEKAKRMVVNLRKNNRNNRSRECSESENSLERQISTEAHGRVDEASQIFHKDLTNEAQISSILFTLLLFTILQSATKFFFVEQKYGATVHF